MAHGPDAVDFRDQAFAQGDRGMQQQRAIRQAHQGHAGTDTQPEEAQWRSTGPDIAGEWLQVHRAGQRGLTVEGFYRTFEFDQHGLAAAVARGAVLDFDPAFADAIFFNVKALFAIES